MQKITPFLWFDNNAEEAITFTFQSSRIPSPAPLCGMAMPDQGLKAR
jgi:predicted 3-demethylubiquinone-9 3-methyltransferase (glyoxalase superfamily)